MEMILNKNFEAYIGLLLFGTNQTVGQTIGDGGGKFSTSSGYVNYVGKSLISTTVKSHFCIAGANSSGPTSVGIGLGYHKRNNTSGDSYVYFAISDAESDLDEYSISSDITSSATYGLECSAIADDNSPKLRYTLTITATTDITIRRIYLIKSLFTVNTSTWMTTSTNFRLGVCTLENPVVLASGESSTFDIDIVI